jgi:antitoxin VapB
MPFVEDSAMAAPSNTERHASLFRNGRNQAVRIPREFELEGTEVLVRKEGDSLIITPIQKPSLLAVLARLHPLDEELPPIDDLPLPPMDTL